MISPRSFGKPFFFPVPLLMSLFLIFLGMPFFLFSFTSLPVWLALRFPLSCQFRSRFFGILCPFFMNLLHLFCILILVVFLYSVLLHFALFWFGFRWLAYQSRVASTHGNGQSAHDLVGSSRLGQHVILAVFAFLFMSTECSCFLPCLFIRFLFFSLFYQAESSISVAMYASFMLNDHTTDVSQLNTNKIKVRASV